MSIAANAAAALFIGLAACGAPLVGAGPTDRPAPIPVVAELPGAAGVVRVRNHPGGYLPRIVHEVEALRSTRQEVRIDGGYCFSACTVYLSLERACVAPYTQFGFHAPTDPETGAPLTGRAFEAATTHVARYYVPELAAWWIREGRYVQRGMALRTGAELIAMGYRACPAED